MIPAAFLSTVYEAGTEQRAAQAFEVRAIAAVSSVLALQLAAFGLAWDIVWHTYVGRDRFLTVPHVLLYFGIGLAGIVVLAAVLYETVHFHAGAPTPGTTQFLGAFHASRGLYVTGFGLLATALAAPLDNYWHELYGIDVTIWAPFHVMGLSGSAITVVGLLYVLAALANMARPRARTVLGFNLYEWLAFLVLAGGCALTYVLSEPGMRQVPRVGSGLLGFLPTPVICAFGMTLCVVTAIAFIGRAEAGAVVIGVYLVRQAVFNVLAPALTRQSVAAHAIGYRISGFEPHVDGLVVVITLTLIPAALFFAVARERAASLWAGAIGGALFGLGTYLWVAAAQGQQVPLPGVAAPLDAVALRTAFLPTLALAAAAGALAAYLGGGFGRLLKAE